MTSLPCVEIPSSSHFTLSQYTQNILSPRLMYLVGCGWQLIRPSVRLLVRPPPAHSLLCRGQELRTRKQSTLEATWLKDKRKGRVQMWNREAATAKCHVTKHQVVNKDVVQIEDVLQWSRMQWNQLVSISWDLYAYRWWCRYSWPQDPQADEARPKCSWCKSAVVVYCTGYQILSTLLQFSFRYYVCFYCLLLRDQSLGNIVKIGAIHNVNRMKKV